MPWLIFPGLSLLGIGGLPVLVTNAQVTLLVHVNMGNTLAEGGLIPFPNKPLFLRVCSTTLLTTISSLMKIVESSSKEEKMLWEKKRLLVMINFSFSHGVSKKTSTSDT